MENLTKYLFCYFTGNEPERERVHFAVSEDGFHFRALNEGRPVITQALGKNAAATHISSEMKQVSFILLQQICEAKTAGATTILL